MLRKIVFVLLALALPVLAATAASAQQYPPSGDGPTSTVVDPGSDASASGVADPGAADPGSGSAPLARTGTDLTVPVTVAVVLLAGGAVALVASRRRTSATLA